MIPSILIVSYFSEFICRYGFKKLVILTIIKNTTTKNLSPRKFLLELMLLITPYISASPNTIQNPILSEK